MPLKELKAKAGKDAEKTNHRAEAPVKKEDMICIAT